MNTKVARGRVVWKAFLLAFLCLLLPMLPSPAGAEDPIYGNRTFERSPSFGPPSTVISVSGTGCIESGKPYTEARVWLSRRGDQAGDPYDTSENYAIRPDGTWSGELRVPMEAPEGRYVLDASCRADDMVFRSGEADFYVGESIPISSPPSPAPSVTTAPRRPEPAGPAVVLPSPSPSSKQATIVAVSSASPSPRVTSSEDAPGRLGSASLLPLSLAAVALAGLGTWGFRRWLSRRS